MTSFLHSVRRLLLAALWGTIGAALVPRAVAIPTDAAAARRILLGEFLTDRTRIVEIQLDRFEAERKGSPEASIAIVEFSDLGCGRCQAFYLIAYPRIEAELVNRGIALFLDCNYYHQTPNHAKALLAAGRQGKYWVMKDRLFNTYKVLNETTYLNVARDIGLDRAAFVAAYRSAEVAQAVTRQKAQGDKVGVSLTPSFIIGWKWPDGTVVGEIFSRAMPWSFFRSRIDQMLAAR